MGVSTILRSCNYDDSNTLSSMPPLKDDQHADGIIIGTTLSIASCFSTDDHGENCDGDNCGDSAARCSRLPSFQAMDEPRWGPPPPPRLPLRSYGGALSTVIEEILQDPTPTVDDETTVEDDEFTICSSSTGGDELTSCSSSSSSSSTNSSLSEDDLSSSSSSSSTDSSLSGDDLSNTQCSDESSDPTTTTSSSCTTLLKENTKSYYDSRGRCIHHPYIRLRKKTLFSGWKILVTACPDCCVEELLGIFPRDDDSKDSYVHGDTTTVKKSCVVECEEKPTNNNHIRPLSASQQDILPSSNSNINTTTTCNNKKETVAQQLASLKKLQRSASRTAAAARRRRSYDNNKDASAIATTITPKTKKNGVLPPSPQSSPPPKKAAATAAPVKVKQGIIDTSCDTESISQVSSGSLCCEEVQENEDCSIHMIQMEYTDVSGLHGHYSGTVNKHLFPHGMGVMTYTNNGMKLEGVWKDGLWSRSEEEEEQRSGSWDASAPSPRLLAKKSPLFENSTKIETSSVRHSDEEAPSKRSKSTLSSSHYRKLVYSDYQEPNDHSPSDSSSSVSTTKEQHEKKSSTEYNKQKSSKEYKTMSPKDHSLSSSANNSSAAFKKKYELGEVARTPRDMVIHRSNKRATQSVSILNKYDQAFLKRSNGLWTVSVVADRGLQPTTSSSSRWYTKDEIDKKTTTMELEESMIFVIDEDGATKIVKKRHWGRYIRCMQMDDVH